VATGAGQQAPYRLTLREAVQKGLQANLRVLLGQTRIDEAQGARERRLSALLPRVRNENLVNLQNRNLRAWHGWKASQQQVEVTRRDYQDARDQIVRQVAGLYLNAQAAQARAEAAQVRVTAADALYKLARDRHDAGVATGVDVLRAQVQLSNERQRLLETRNDAQQALLLLARNIGMNPGTPIELAEVLQFKATTKGDLAQLLQSSLLGRPDYLSLQTQRLVLMEQQRASHARYWPKFSIGGNYGFLGRSMGDLPGTGLLQGTLSITLYDRDRKGEELELAARLTRVDDQLADLKLGIEEEIRESMLNFDSATEQVAVAQEGRELAQQELDLAQDRFKAGVTNNIEVTNAQDSLARAQENYIVAVTRHADAKFALARAMGGTEQNYERYLELQ
jgi:outer membrane protein TolC